MARNKALAGDGTITQKKDSKGNLSYMCRIYYNGKYYSAQAATKAEARKKAQAKLKQFKKAIYSKSEIRQYQNETLSKSLMAFIDLHYSSSWSSNTAEHRKGEIKAVILNDYGTVQVKNLNRSFLSNVFLSAYNKYSSKYVKNPYNIMRKYISKLFEDAVIEEDFLLKPLDFPRKAPKEFKENEEYIEADEYKIFAEDELNKINDLRFNISFAVGDKSTRNEDILKYHASIVYAMFLTGMRSGEMRALTVEDINLQEHTIKINKALSTADGKTIIKPPKTKAGRRIIGINQETEEILKYIIDNRPNKDTNRIIVNSAGGYIERSTFIKMFDKVLRHAGIKKNGRALHALRHSFISYSIEKNIISPLWEKEIIFISRYVGHDDISTTLNTYSHIQMQKLKDVDYFKYDEEKIPVLDIEFN